MINPRYLETLQEYESSLNFRETAYHGMHEDIHTSGYFPSYVLDKKSYPFIVNRSLTTYVPNNNEITDQFQTTDSYDRFHENLRKSPPDWIYRRKNVTYDVNSLGYRAPEFSSIRDWKNAIPIFGCSCVFGTGLANEDTISERINFMTGYQTINFGYPGGSNELILNNIINLLEFVPEDEFPRNLIIGWTCMDRCIYYGRDIHNLGSWTLNTPDKGIFYRYALATNEEQMNAYMKQFHIASVVKQLLKGKTNLIEFSFFPDAAKYMRCDIPTKEITWDFARDNLHPGIECSTLVSNNLVGKLK